MFDLHESTKREQEELRRIGEAEALIRTVMEQKRGAVAEKRAVLEAQLIEAEDALQQKKLEAMKVHAQAAAEHAEASKREAGLMSAWPEVERATAAVEATEERISETRRYALDRADIEKRQVEEMGSLYQVYCAVTGVRWHPHVDGIEGYVAIGNSARAFEVSPSEAADRVATADSLWEEIEACLPTEAGGKVEQPRSSRPSLTGLVDLEEEEESDIYFER